MSLKVLRASSENCQQMIAALPAPEFLHRLIERLLDGKLVRPERIAEARRWLDAGEHPDAEAVADAVVRETRLVRG